MAIFNRFGLPVTVAAAATVDDQTVAFIDFPQNPSVKRQLAEAAYLKADGGWQEVREAFAAAEAATDQRTKLLLITAFREMEARVARRDEADDE